MVEKQGTGFLMGTFTKRALVIGGGIAGIQAALDIADGGYEVILVERSPSIGGHMIQYAEVFPTLDCPQCILTPKMVEIAQHPNVKLMTCAEVQKVSGGPGNFEVEILQKSRRVDHNKCNGCGTCWQKCPEKTLSEYDDAMAKRTAVYIPFPQAVPAKPVIDCDHCRYIRYQEWMAGTRTGKKPPQCRICEKLCPVGAIDWEQKDEVITEKVGAIVVATGFDLMPISLIPEYAEDPDVLNGIQFERLLSPGGPTAGVVTRPSDGKVPKEMVFVSCCGSRDPEHGVPYCSRVCCMYLAKQALLYKHAVPDGQAYIFYIDIRSTGKGYEEFIQRVQSDGVVYLRGKVSKIFRDGDKLRVYGADTLSGKRVEIAADLVVLGMAVMPSAGTKEVAAKLGIDLDDSGFVSESHAKFNPLETTVPGIFVAGMAQGPKDIPDAVAQGSGAAGRVLTFFAQAGKELVVV
ncbi:MAG: CoB--CoM heterodisulfide reductase iron-sulfur subunit A family protein [Dehalococcoidia bacterium]|nr:CoB--CoM heterodisulfide reductase iron-sulfur subunit A family protein [Dehalococcoidia bacterium]